MKLAGKLFRRGAKNEDEGAYAYDADPNDLDDFDDSRRLDLDTITLDDLDVPGRDRVSAIDDDDDGYERPIGRGRGRSRGRGRVRPRGTTKGSGGGSKVRPILLVALVAVMLVVVAVQGYSILFGGPSGGDVPIVRAADDPVKVKPETPGGLDVPYQDQLVMNQPAEGGEGGKVERLLPPPEAPKPPQAAERKPLTAQEIVELTARAAKLRAAAGPSPGPEMTDTGGPAPEAGTSDSTAGIEAPETQVIEPAAPKPAATQQAALPKQEPVAAPGDGRFFIQLLSLTSKNGTKASWTKLQQAHPEQLGDRRLFVEEAEVKGRTYYRVQAGRFASRDAANAVCGQLKARSQDCLVLRR